MHSFDDFDIRRLEANDGHLHTHIKQSPQVTASPKNLHKKQPIFSGDFSNPRGLLSAVSPQAPQHFLYFLPLPQKHGSLRPGLTSA